MSYRLTRGIFEEMDNKQKSDEEEKEEEDEKKEDPPFAPDANMTIKDDDEGKDEEQGEEEKEDDEEKNGMDQFANSLGVLQNVTAEKLNKAADKANLRQIDDDEFHVIDSDDLQLGAEVELEHTKDIWTAAVIAAHHILEFSDYYDRLKKMEDEAKQESSPDPGAPPSHSMDPHGDGEDDGW